MSTTDPRRDAEDRRPDEPATAVAADTNRTDADRSDADRTDTNRTDVLDDGDRGRHAAPTPPDGAIRDSERADAVHDSERADALRDRTGRDDDHGTDRTRVLPVPEESSVTDRRHDADRRASDERPTVAVPAAAPPAAERTAETPAERGLNPRSVLAREKEEFGGMRFWLAFFGWLTATGLAVLLGAIAGGILAAVGNSNGATSSSAGLQSLGLAGAIVTAVILFIAYYAGGYVAGRMARFSGAKQGVAVWLWAIIISVLAAIAGAIGSQFGLFSQVGSVAQVPINGQTLTLAGIVGIVAALVLSLLGAVLGGLAGMRFHRKVDRAAFGA